MLRVTLECVPCGVEHRKQVIGTLIIGNDATGTARWGSYMVQLFAEGREPREATVKHWDRRREAWALVARAIRAGMKP